MEKKVSIIIPFTSLNNYVLECIRHCLELDYSNFELILLPDDEIKLAKEFKDKRIKIIETGDLIIAKKRNIGILKYPKTDFYAFIDSDAYPIKDWLKNAIGLFSKSKEIWAVGGPNITPIAEDIYKRAVGNSLKSFLISGKNSFRKKISKNRFCNDLPSCNLIVKKQAIDVLKGFNEQLVTGEDIEFCNRIIKENKKICYNNKVIVYHHNRSLFLPFIFQRIIYGLSVFKVFKTKPSLHSLSLFSPFFFLLFLVFGLILGIFNQIIFYIWLSVILFYLFILIIETFTYCSKVSEIPLTFIALLIGNLSPGIGSLLALFKIKLNVKKIYKNYEYEKPNARNKLIKPKLISMKISKYDKESSDRFGYEWDKYNKIIPDHEEQFLKWSFPLEPKDFKNKKILDAGCGIGRNSYWPLIYGAKEIVAFDCDPRSVKVAKTNLTRFKNAKIEFGSLYESKYENEFDISFAIGVIHHLEHPRKAIKTLVKATKPGGIVYIWVYGHEGVGSWVVYYMNPIRMVTSRLPIRITHAISYIFSIPLYFYLKFFSHQNKYFKQLSRFSFWHVSHIIFDQLLPKTAKYWKKQEALALFENQGLEDIKIFNINDISWTVIGKKSKLKNQK